jgi:hypothetical protein
MVFCLNRLISEYDYLNEVSITSDFKINSSKLKFFFKIFKIVLIYWMLI